MLCHVVICWWPFTHADAMLTLCAVECRTMNQVFDAMHSVFMNQLSVYMAVFSIPRLMDPSTQEEVG